MKAEMVHTTSRERAKPKKGEEEIIGFPHVVRDLGDRAVANTLRAPP